MSLLGTPVFANTTTPLWIGSGGGSSSGPVIAPSFTTTPGGDVIVRDLDGTSGLRLATSGTPSTGIAFIQGQTTIAFGKVGTGVVNSSITLSAPGANTDTLTIGGTVDALALKLANTGAAPVVGSGTLALGTATIVTNSSDVTSFILISRGGVNASTALGQLRVSNKGANNFTVVSADPANPTSTEQGDLSSFDWIIINPA